MRVEKRYALAMLAGVSVAGYTYLCDNDLEREVVIFSPFSHEKGFILSI